MINQQNIYQLAPLLPNQELFEVLLTTPNILIERIVSTGQSTPDGQWYDQDRDEWVILLQGQAQLSYEDGRIVELLPGNYLHLPAHQKHRVEATSSNPPCIWLAVHFSA